MNELIDLPQMDDIDVTAQELLDELTCGLLEERRKDGEITVELFRQNLAAAGVKIDYKTAYTRIIRMVDEGALSERVTAGGKKFFKKIG
jgi:hypothetical protein